MNYPTYGTRSELREAEALAREAFMLTQQLAFQGYGSDGMQFLGLVFGARNQSHLARVALVRALLTKITKQGQGLIHAYLAETALWERRIPQAQTHADRAWKLADDQRVAADLTRAARLQGTVALHLGNFGLALERLSEAVKRVHACDRVEQELPTMITLAEWH